MEHLYFTNSNSRTVPEQFQNSSKIYKFKSHRLCLLEIQDLTTKWGEFAVPYIPFDWGGISPSFPRDPFHTPFIWAGLLPIVAGTYVLSFSVCTVWLKHNVLAYYNIRHFHLGRTVSHVNTRANFDGTESCVALFKSSKRFWIWRRGLLKSKQKYWGTLILNYYPTLKSLLFKNEYFWCKNITLGKRGEILHYDIHKK